MVPGAALEPASAGCSLRPQTCSPPPPPTSPAPRVQTGCPLCVLSHRSRAVSRPFSAAGLPAPSPPPRGVALASAEQGPRPQPRPTPLVSSLIVLLCLARARLPPEPSRARASLGEAESSAPAPWSLRPALLLPVTLRSHTSAALCGASGLLIRVLTSFYLSPGISVSL